MYNRRKKKKRKIRIGWKGSYFFFFLMVVGKEFKRGREGSTAMGSETRLREKGRSPEGDRERSTKKRPMVRVKAMRRSASN